MNKLEHRERERERKRRNDYQGNDGDESVENGEAVKDSVLPKRGGIDVVPPTRWVSEIVCYHRRRRLHHTYAATPHPNPTADFLILWWLRNQWFSHLSTAGFLWILPTDRRGWLEIATARRRRKRQSNPSSKFIAFFLSFFFFFFLVVSVILFLFFVIFFFSAILENSNSAG